MNDETVNLIERPYLEIVDDILTAVVGGVVNEPIIFDVKMDRYPLAEPAQDVRGITGTIHQNGKSVHHVFQKEIDFIFSSGDNAVIWPEGGTRPEDESTFYVDYFRQDSRSPLTDINVGSVTRTISEAIGREIATVYQQLNEAYLSAFIDTAKGKSLDLVVSILGVTRKTKDFATGRVTFFRDPAVSGNITIPEGILLATSKGEANFETTQLRTLQAGQVRIDVPVRASEAFAGEAGRVDAGAITELAQPIAGINRVTNFDATILGAEDESDAELRARAKAVLRALGKGTLAALSRVIFEERAILTETWDPNGSPPKQSNLGEVVLLVETEPERFPSLRAAVEETRSAGVLTTLVARYIFFKPRLVITVSPGLTGVGKEKIIQQIIEALQAYVDGLSSGNPAEGQALLEAIKGVDDVQEAKIVDVIAWRSDIGQPGAETLVDAIVTAIKGTPPDDADALRTAISDVVSEEAPSLLPSSRRIPDRSLVQGPSGERATDEELESGDFKVVAEVNGEEWWVVLDMEPADIALAEEVS
jgi:hypothetical protein